MGMPALHFNSRTNGREVKHNNISHTQRTQCENVWICYIPPFSRGKWRGLGTLPSPRRSLPTGSTVRPGTDAPSSPTDATPSFGTLGRRWRKRHTLLTTGNGGHEFANKSGVGGSWEHVGAHMPQHICTAYLQQPFVCNA